jgi:YD repeat-containing protein
MALYRTKERLPPLNFHMMGRNEGNGIGRTRTSDTTGYRFLISRRKNMKYRASTRFLMLALLVIFFASTSVTAAVINYTYDNAGRLTGVDYGGGKKISYDYDLSGNLLKCSIPFDLADAVYVLQLLTRMEPSQDIAKDSDVNADGKVGLEEVLYILQSISGLR